jgi:hypothetical protein
LIADGLKYEHDANTLESSLGYQRREVIKDGEIGKK